MPALSPLRHTACFVTAAVVACFVALPSGAQAQSGTTAPRPLGAPGVQGTNGNNGTVGGAQPGVERPSAKKPMPASSAPAPRASSPKP